MLTFLLHIPYIVVRTLLNCAVIIPKCLIGFSYTEENDIRKVSLSKYIAHLEAAE